MFKFGKLTNQKNFQYSLPRFSPFGDLIDSTILKTSIITTLDGVTTAAYCLPLCRCYIFVPQLTIIMVAVVVEDSSHQEGEATN